MAVHTIDLHYLGIPESIAAYVVTGPEGPVLIETGPASTFSSLENGLNDLGISLNEVQHALVTHIHLDHAGAAGHLARNGAQIYVHEFGAQHLVDPSKLIESARRIYGDRLEKLWGYMLPVPEKQVHPVHDNDVIRVCGLEISAIDTPGHAKHHHSFSMECDERRICFTGDVGGMTIPGIPEPPEGKYIPVPTPPPEFNLEDWLASIDRLQALHFDAIYPTHFGRRDNVSAHFDRLKTLLSENAELVRFHLEAGKTRDEIMQLYIAWNRVQSLAEGIKNNHASLYVTNNLLRMNVDGLIRYWSKKLEFASQQK